MKKIVLSMVTGFAGMMALALPSAQAANGTWTLNNSGNWSTTGNWSGGTIADGAGFTADFSQLDINQNRTVTIDTTSRTIGTLLIGDSTAPLFNYTLAASGGATLTFNNSGSAAVLNQTAGANTISAPIVLADDLSATNNSTGLLTVSGGITGAKNLSLNVTGTGGITLSTGSVNNGGTITNLGNGTATTTISGVIGTNVTGVVQNANNTFLLSGANTYTTGTTIKKGNILANNATSLGTGTVLLGDTTGSANAGLYLAGSAVTFANNIIVQAGSTGNTLTLASNGGVSTRTSGTITLNNNLTLSVDGGGNNGLTNGSYLAIQGNIVGTGALTLNVTGALSTSNNTANPVISSLNVGLTTTTPPSTTTITTTGPITNVGTGTGRAQITSNITGTTSVTQNSATSQLLLNATGNTYSGVTTVNAGTLYVSSSGSLSPNSTVTIASGASLILVNTQGTASQTLNVGGNGTSFNMGALEALNSTSYLGSTVLTADTTIASSVFTTTTFTLGTVSTTSITGLGKNLTVTGTSNTDIKSNITTGTGGLTKSGIGILTLSGANTYTGLTRINLGTLALNNANALGGGGNLTFDGGLLQYTSANNVDYSTRIVNSTGAISIDTNNQTRTLGGGLAASNTGGLVKLGTNTLTLSGTNNYKGLTVVKGGNLAVSAVSALPSTSSIFIDSLGALNSGGAYADVTTWLGSGKIAAGSTGSIALTGNSTENINFAGYNGLSLGASSNATYTGTLTAAGGVYRLGGSSATLTLSATNALTGANALAINNGTVVLSGQNNMSGATTVSVTGNSSTGLTLSGAGGLNSSAITVNPGATLTITPTAGGTVTRAAGITLDRGTLNVTGVTAANTTESIGNLAIGSKGNSIITVTGSTGRNALLSAGSYTRSAGATVLLRGTSLGVNNIGSAITSGSISFTAPNLVGGIGANTTDEGILVGAVGDTAANGTGFAATGGLLTYDGTKGVRQITAYKSTISDGQTQLDNVQLASTSGVVTTTINNDTTINSLSIKTSGATTAGVAVTGTGKLIVNSGVIYGNAVTSTTVSTISNNVDFNGREGLLMVGGSTDLTLSGVLSNTGGNGLTIYGTRTVTLSGTAANTYTGTTTVNGGTLSLNKTSGLDTVTGNIVVNSGGTLNSNQSNLIADGANISVDNGTVTTLTETFNDLTLTNGGRYSYAGNNNGGIFTLNGNVSISGMNNFSNVSTLTVNTGGQLNVAGTVSLSDNGLLVLGQSNRVDGVYDSISNIGGLNITNTTSGAYRAISFTSSGSVAQAAAQLVLNGDLNFTGNSTNNNTVLIDAQTGYGNKGVIALTGASPGQRNFNIGNGAAAVDLRVTAALIDGAGGPSGLNKNGTGTLALTGANTYTGVTNVNAGTLLINGSLISDVTVNTGGNLGGSGTFNGAITIASGGALSPGNSPGLAVANAGLTFNTGSNFNFELAADTTAGRGVSFDGVDVTGGVLTIQSGVIANLIFNAAGSTVDFASTFWDSNQSWLVFDNANAATGLFGSINTSVDSLGASFATTGGSFSFATSGNDILLNYTATIPEPSTYALFGMGLGALWLLRRKRSGTV